MPCVTAVAFTDTLQFLRLWLATDLFHFFWVYGWVPFYVTDLPPVTFVPVVCNTDSDSLLFLRLTICSISAVGNTDILVFFRFTMCSNSVVRVVQVGNNYTLKFL